MFELAFLFVIIVAVSFAAIGYRYGGDHNQREVTKQLQIEQLWIKIDEVDAKHDRIRQREIEDLVERINDLEK